MALVREYARNNSNEAFSELVNRHIRLVYSVALRQARDPHLAEEITQVVFIILARKARSLGPETVLSAWLCRTARYASANALKIQTRRHHYEQKAQQEASMQSTVNENPSETWREIAPLLDDALGALGEKEHNAIVLRFLDGKDFKQVAAALNMGEDAARMRVNRALERLRKFFCKRGVVSSTEVIAQEISANGLQAAPPDLAGAVASAALAKGAAGTATLALMSETLKTMTWANVKFACGVAIAVLLAGSVGVAGITFFPQSSQDDRNDRYQIEGDLDYGGGRFIRDFVLTVNGSNWAVHLVNSRNPPPSWDETPPEDEVCLNGTIYSYDYYGKQPAGSPAINSGGATIEYGDSAVEDGTFADFVWAGLASGYYFSHQTNDQVTGLFAISANARDWLVHADWQLNDAPPHLPKSIDYFEGPMHATTVRPGPTILYSDKVWKAGDLRVLKSTTINGRTFPTEYTYEQFRQNLNNPASSNNVQLQISVNVNVRKIILHHVPVVQPPKCDGVTAVTDYRLSYDLTFSKKVNPPREITYGTFYDSTASRLPEKPEAAAIKAYKKQLRMLRIPYHPPPDH